VRAASRIRTISASGTASGLNVHTDRRLRKMSQMFASAAVEVSAAAVGAARLPNTIPEPRRAALDLRKVLRSMFMEDGALRWGLESGDVSGSECENESEGGCEVRESVENGSDGKDGEERRTWQWDVPAASTFTLTLTFTFTFTPRGAPP